MSIFDWRASKMDEQEAPLAARMRPRTLDEYVGQEHIVGPGRLLRRAIEADQLSSLIFFGPPGTGKTTLARVIANTTHAQFTALNAVLAGVKDIREAITAARERRGQFGQRTILFVDEVHRFNKAQQDALLPWVENGTVILVGATTENPYFEVNKALVSRSRVFQLQPLEARHLHKVIHAALRDEERGFGALPVIVEQAAADHLVNVANGDARALLNALELAVETTLPEDDGTRRVSLSVAEESIQQRAVLYDKEGDAHFDIVSAFIKSVRGSDPDAALYWLARMVYAGEDPRFLFRRLIILASEDIGMAEPNAIVVVNACAQAYDRIGMPEGRYPLAQATLYLATCPKSNSAMAFFDALAAVGKEQSSDVPAHLKDASRDGEGFGHGAGYLYPHAYRDHWVAQQYLPASLQGRVFYEPSDRGYEAAIADDVARRREAQVAAMLDHDMSAPTEVLTTSPQDPQLDAWLQRTLGGSGERLAMLRDKVFDAAAPQRHHIILDVHAGSGLFTWEAVRRAPEGGVWAWEPELSVASSLRTRAEQLPALRRPVVHQGTFDELVKSLEETAPRLERIVGRNALLRASDRPGLLQRLRGLLHDAGRIVLAESVPSLGQRIYELLAATRAAETLDKPLWERWRAAEEAIFADPDDAMTNWGTADITAWCQSAGFSCRLLEVPSASQLRVTDAILDRWFAARSAAEQGRASYAERLLVALEPDEVHALERLVRRTLRDKTVPWHAMAVIVQADPRPAGA